MLPAMLFVLLAALSVVSQTDAFVHSTTSSYKYIRGLTSRAAFSSSRTALHLSEPSQNSELESLKQTEHELRDRLKEITTQKREILAARPLSIGIIGFGRFGQFMAERFVAQGANVAATSRTDYTKEANAIGCKFEPSLGSLFEKYEFDVVIVSVSILSFEDTVNRLSTYLRDRDVLVVDVLSVKEHARRIFLKALPPSCDILCTHPMFGPESGAESWRGLNLYVASENEERSDECYASELRSFFLRSLLA